ncbi:hypothetical protein DNTS_026569 [Danionella cerebrum]|uniref:Uncharacterized protein n=1 Tax=Danionella cerebrum TaxID=2873325 RepID=A0A553RDM5_9TELE|nr:hypothetical protein DNTS_026569 [Danionella translucida]
MTEILSGIYQNEEQRERTESDNSPSALDTMGSDTEMVEANSLQKRRRDEGLVLKAPPKKQQKETCVTVLNDSSLDVSTPVMGFGNNAIGKNKNENALEMMGTIKGHDQSNDNKRNDEKGTEKAKGVCLNFRACPAAESKFESRGVHAYQDFLHGDIKPQGKGILQASYWFGLRLPIWFKLT